MRSTTARAVDEPRIREANGATTVSISAEARRLAASTPPMDEAKVTRLREAFQANTYTVQPARIAQALLQARAA